MAIIQHEMTLQEAWQQVKNQLREAAKNPGHSFRFLDFATMGKDHTPNQRTVVLREFNEPYELTIFTDRRSQKVEDIRINASVSLLFYDDKEKLQVSIKGKASLITEGPEHKEYWTAAGSKGAHSYTSEKAPGTPIHQPEEAYEWELDNPENFCVIKVKATHIEFLQLIGEKHLRSSSDLKEGEWHSQWITP